MGWGGVGRGSVGLGAGARPPIQRYVASKEQWLRCRGSDRHADVVRARMLTTPKGAGWKRVSVMSVVSRVPVISEVMPDEVLGRGWCSMGKPKIAF